MGSVFETRFGMRITAVGMSILAVGGLFWFAVHSAQLFVGLAQRTDVINFDKGAMYMLGGGMGLIGLVAMRAPAVFVGKRMPEAIEKWILKGLLAGVILMFTLPHLVHAGISATLKNRDYVICEELTTRWLMHVTFVYADSPERCLDELMTRH